MDASSARAALAGCAAGALATAAVGWYMKRQQANDANTSTTSSAQAFGVYETNKAVAEYLMFHFGKDEDILPYAAGPKNALNFASRTAALCVEWATKTGLPLDSAFDVGCAVGRTSFDLTESFSRVVGLDFSHAFIAAANALKVDRAAPFSMSVEGETTVSLVARVPETAQPGRVTFLQGDACALPSAAALGGRFSVIHGANLLCRLPEPTAFLSALPSLLLPRGLVVLVSPYSWLTTYTAKEKWMGGRKEGPVSSAATLTKHMNGLGFTLVHQGDCPFLIREHARKFQWGCSHITIWQLNA